MLVVSLLALIIVLIPAYTGGLSIYDGQDAVPYSWPIIGNPLFFMAELLTTAGLYIVIPFIILSIVFLAVGWQKLTQRKKLFILGALVFTLVVWISPYFAGRGVDWRAIKGWLDG
jgi:hypothetical protein